jgi:hypothetical protein
MKRIYYTSTLSKGANPHHLFRYTQGIHLGVDILLQGIILVRNLAVYTDPYTITLYHGTLPGFLYLIMCKRCLCFYSFGPNRTCGTEVG